MTVTFSEFAATADAREQIAANALKYTKMLCEGRNLALLFNFV